MATFKNLHELRERLGYRFQGVVRLTGLLPERLQAIESGAAAPTIYETEQLARIYAVDADVLADEPIKLPATDIVHALASLDEFREVGDTVRSRILAAAQASRDLVWLRKQLGDAVGIEKFMSERPTLSTKADRLPALQGARLATELRRCWGLRTQPIISLRDEIAKRLPSIEILYADLTSEGPAGLSFLDRVRGPAIVLNLVGKNENPLVRRFSLAHELCHLLVDWSTKAPLAQISGYLTESGLEREQRANGFAVRLLCPETVLTRLQRTKTLDAVEMARELAKYGLHYSALRLYMHNVARLELPAIPPTDVIFDPGVWTSREAPPDFSAFPLKEVPHERRTTIARLAAQGYSRGILTRARFAELLGVTRFHSMERVLDSLGLDPPAQDAA
ncbi:MAG: ImmA/IrrE family metallo-endopeptidase [Byssovorax sp.]